MTSNQAGQWPNTYRLFTLLKYPLDLYQQIFQFEGSKQMTQYIVDVFAEKLFKGNPATVLYAVSELNIPR